MEHSEGLNWVCHLSIAEISTCICNMQHACCMHVHMLLYSCPSYSYTRHIYGWMIMIIII